MVFAGLAAGVLFVLLLGGIVVVVLLSRGLSSGNKNVTPPANPTTSNVILLKAPALKAPADNATFDPKASVTLSWEGLGDLANDDYYALALDCQTGPGAQTMKVKTTTYTVPESIYNSLKDPYSCRWNVTAMKANGSARSAPSNTWQFKWTQATARPEQPTATSTLASTSTSTPTPPATATATARPATSTATSAPPTLTPPPPPTATDKPDKEPPPKEPPHH